MGLDMHLTKEIYVAAQYPHRKVKLNVGLTIEDNLIKIDASNVQSITEQAAYWRKANAIHGWFVENVQYGSDDCDRYGVELSELKDLLNTCRTVISTKDTSLLPPMGGTDIDDGYWNNLKYTEETLNKLITEHEENDYNMDISYFYHSSW